MFGGHVLATQFCPFWVTFSHHQTAILQNDERRMNFEYVVGLSWPQTGAQQLLYWFYNIGSALTIHVKPFVVEPPDSLN